MLCCKTPVGFSFSRRDDVDEVEDQEDDEGGGECDGEGEKGEGGGEWGCGWGEGGHGMEVLGMFFVFVLVGGKEMVGWNGGVEEMYLSMRWMDRENRDRGI